ncbi:MAG: YebC/PmpR family DNA-binding transcriptional regulator [Alphaproteobacteria bacterium]|nr:YebC/PmpR family DNA-binding transcriptional regulator [Alphaproteobacteria bacterium]NCB49638.1 YebC/PmpR family DNA-binding transcriptional regulator [Alphaproteobacteria bacterium]
MSGHSQFSNIMHRKGAQDKVKARIFAKLSKEITVAAKAGLPDPDANPRLRSAIQAARAENMPKDNIERAINKGASNEADSNFEEIRYEGYAPGNIAVIVEALTDNRNRTAPVLRSLFGKRGGSLGETNSVTFNFERIGYLEYALDVADADTMFENALEAGASDVQTTEETHEITCAPDDLNTVREYLEAKFGTPNAARLEWKPLVETEITDEDKAQSFLNFVDALNDEDDVQRVFTNAKILPEILEKLDEEC